MEYLKIFKIISGINSARELHKQWKEHKDDVKYCVQCGTQFNAGALICPKCGKIDPVDLKGIILAFGVFFLEVLGGILVIIALAFGILAYTHHGIIQQVKETHLEAYPTIAIEDAFEGFFTDPKWSYGENSGDQHTVIFFGRCLYLNEEVTANITISCTEDSRSTSFESLDFNGVPQSDYVLSQLLNAVYENDQE